MDTIEPIEERGFLPENDYIMVPMGIQTLAISREEFIQGLPRNGQCAEIGVAQGGFSRKILNVMQPKIFYMIDSWDMVEDDEHYQKAGLHNEEICRSLFSKLGNVSIMKGFSLEICKLFPVETFDFIYLDASHVENDVLADMKAWWPKIKPGGWLMGHDFCTTGTWPYGVVPAVNKFYNEVSVQNYGMTEYTGAEFPSFILQKP